MHLLCSSSSLACMRASGPRNLFPYLFSRRMVPGPSTPLRNHLWCTACWQQTLNHGTDRRSSRPGIRERHRLCRHQLWLSHRSRIQNRQWVRAYVPPAPHLFDLTITPPSPGHARKTGEDRPWDEQGARRDTSHSQASHGGQRRTQHCTQAHASVEFRVGCWVYHGTCPSSLSLSRTDKARSCTDARDSNVTQSSLIGTTSKNVWMPFGRARLTKDVSPLPRHKADNPRCPCSVPHPHLWRRRLFLLPRLLGKSRLVWRRRHHDRARRPHQAMALHRNPGTPRMGH